MFSNFYTFMPFSLLFLPSHSFVHYIPFVNHIFVPFFFYYFYSMVLYYHTIKGISIFIISHIFIHIISSYIPFIYNSEMSKETRNRLHFLTYIIYLGEKFIYYFLFIPYISLLYATLLSYHKKYFNI